MRLALTTLLVVSLAAFGQIDAQDWNTVVTFMPGQTLQDILVTNDTTIYAVSSLNNGQGTGLNIKKSIDGGDTWVQQQTNIPNENFRNMATPDGETVFVIGNNSSFITNNGTDTWSNINIDIPSMPLRCIFFASENIGYLGADMGTIYKTTDGGETWFDLNPTINGSNVGTVSEIYFLSEERGFIAGSSYLKFTLDGGQTWNDVPGFEPNNGFFNIREMQFLDDETGFLCGDSGLVLTTSDGGATWTELTTPTSESLQDLFFLDKQTGYVCGFGAVIIQTSDGGDTWTEMTTDQQDLFRAIDFNSTSGFMTTQQGSILKFDLTTSSDDINKKAEFIKLYPNPVLDRLFLDGLDRFEDIQGWRIVDVSGRMMMSGQRALLNNEPIMIDQLTPGVYYFVLEAGSRSISRLFIKH
ncbi:MAG: YCF48-related protein [Bacteroidota bacterium]